MIQLNHSRSLLMSLFVLGALGAQAQLTVPVRPSNAPITVLQNPFNESLALRFDNLNYRGKIAVVARHDKSGERFGSDNFYPHQGLTMDSQQFPAGSYTIEVYRADDRTMIAQGTADRQEAGSLLMNPSEERSSGDTKTLLTLPVRPNNSAITVLQNPFNESLGLRFDNLNYRGKITVVARHDKSGERFGSDNFYPHQGLTMDSQQFPAGSYTIEVYRADDRTMIAQGTADRQADDTAQMNPGEERSSGDTKSVSTAAKQPFTAYPNPFSDRINVRFQNGKYSGPVRLELRELSNGQLVISAVVDPKEIANFSTGDVPPGRYLLEVRNASTNELYGAVQMRK